MLREIHGDNLRKMYLNSVLKMPKKKLAEVLLECLERWLIRLRSYTFYSIQNSGVKWYVILYLWTRIFMR